jgi:NAD+ kinase
MFIKKIQICANYQKPNTEKILREILNRLEACGIKTVFANEIVKDCDAVITIGGDGTILRWGKKAAILGKPLLGINTGHLGFMATLETNELQKLERLTSGDYGTSKRMLLEVEAGEYKVYALNDVVLTKGNGSRLPDFSVNRIVKNSAETIQEIIRVRSDGIIFSTATGSTAYSLSAGGPIIEPELECIEITPLCAHSLFDRPMIFTANATLAVSYRNHDSTVFLSADGEEALHLVPGEKVTIKKADLILELIDIESDGFYQAVNKKLLQPLK